MKRKGIKWNIRPAVGGTLFIANTGTRENTFTIKSIRSGIIEITNGATFDYDTGEELRTGFTRAHIENRTEEDVTEEDVLRFEHKEAVENLTFTISSYTLTKVSTADLTAFNRTIRESQYHEDFRRDDGVTS